MSIPRCSDAVNGNVPFQLTYQTTEVLFDAALPTELSLDCCLAGSRDSSAIVEQPMILERDTSCW